MNEDITTNPLNEAIIDVARGLERNAFHNSLRSAPGPNGWDAIVADDFSKEHDFEITEHGSSILFTPVSEAGLQWCYKALPPDAPRHGSRSYVIEPHFIDGVIKGCRRDGLRSIEDYEEAAENDQLALQGDNE
jgi:hypothetical protein